MSRRTERTLNVQQAYDSSMAHGVIRQCSRRTAPQLLLLVVGGHWSVVNCEWSMVSASSQLISLSVDVCNNADDDDVFAATER